MHKLSTSTWKDFEHCQSMKSQLQDWVLGVDLGCHIECQHPIMKGPVQGLTLPLPMQVFAQKASDDGSSVWVPELGDPG